MSLLKSIVDYVKNVGEYLSNIRDVRNAIGLVEDAVARKDYLSALQSNRRAYELVSANHLILKEMGFNPSDEVETLERIKNERESLAMRV
ncbi:MAG: hypothetical protein ABIH37_04130 [archaeon]